MTRKTVLIHASLAALALALGGEDLQGQPIKQHSAIAEHRKEAASLEDSGPGRPEAETAAKPGGVRRKGDESLSVSEKLVTAQAHKHNMIRRESHEVALLTEEGLMLHDSANNEKSQPRDSVMLEVRSVGGLTSGEARAHSLSPDLDVQVVAGSTHTTTLSAIHLIASTTVNGLKPPPEVSFASTTQAMRSTMQPADPPSDPDSGLLLEKTASAAVAKVLDNPTALQVPDNLAAFEVSGAGSSNFNGIYFIDPSQPNSVAGACCTLTWMKQGSTELLYNTGAWVLSGRVGSTMTDVYNGPDDGTCAPETASWATLDASGGTTPTVARRTASLYTTTTTTTLDSGGTSGGATTGGTTSGGTTGGTSTAAASYYVVTGAGIPGFNGVYYETSLLCVSEDCRCERDFAKDGPDNTEYTLDFNSAILGPNSRGMWYFQHKTGTGTGDCEAPDCEQTYWGEDDGSCSPEKTAFVAKMGTNALATCDPTTVVRTGCPVVSYSLTATTTTTTTTTTMGDTTTTTRSLYVFTTVTTTTGTELNTTQGAAETTSTLSTTNSDNLGVKLGSNRGCSLWWLRLLLPLSLVGALEVLSFSV